MGSIELFDDQLLDITVQVMREDNCGKIVICLCLAFVLSKGANIDFKFDISYLDYFFM